MNNKYAKAYVEVLEIIKHLPKDEYNKIPKEKIIFYETNKDNNYKYSIDISKEIYEQNISKDANVILTNLKSTYYEDL